MIAVIVGLILIVVGILGIWFLLNHTKFDEEATGWLCAGIIGCGAVIVIVGLLCLGCSDKEYRIEDITIIEKVVQSNGDLVHVSAKKGEEGYRVDFYIPADELSKILGKEGYTK